jgi:hypothetical protein
MPDVPLDDFFIYTGKQSLVGLSNIRRPCGSHWLALDKSFPIAGSYVLTNYPFSERHILIFGTCSNYK